ncbi:hypothetical protein SKAU_G00136250 [Synaphobranchus kaupii]|uniref:Uncharacterized protein n=1 Tax=Synaphobranchus kaupii TaxID=118154 RepID=A0A9Q1FRL9_SYNKA|nr:hypothetical protein SKAU_G00136250 [Synaphobranchus kaupii]
MVENNTALTKQAANMMVEDLQKDLARKNAADSPTTLLSPTSSLDTEKSWACFPVCITLFHCTYLSLSHSPLRIESDSEEAIVQPKKNKEFCIDEETQAALKDLPGLVKSLKNLVTALQQGSPTSNWSTSTSASDSPAPIKDCSEVTIPIC